MLRVTPALVLYLLLSCAAATAQPADPDAAARDLAQTVRPLTDESLLNPLIERAAHARLVLLGEASHGTSEYYTWRAAISRQLILNGDFRFVAVEGDWSSIYELNRYVKHLDGGGESARSIMEGFSRWPIWMWANEEMAEFVEWLRTHNATLPDGQKVGIYGIDVYGTWNSIREAKGILRPTPYHRQARSAFACMQRHDEDPGAYVRSVAAGSESCEDRVIALLDVLQADIGLRESLGDRRWFKLEQHLLVTRSAKGHYLAMATRGPESWNRRVEHFKLTASRLLGYHGPDSRGIVWAHNTHIGDARATSMAAGGQKNIGQLAREHFGKDEVFAVGFGTYRGHVLAGASWEAPMQVMQVPDAMPGSLEDMLNRVDEDAFLLLMDDPRLPHALHEIWDHRAIGVVYDPQREAPGNYVPTIPAERYDAFIFIRTTRPLAAIR